MLKIVSSQFQTRHLVPGGAERYDQDRADFGSEAIDEISTIIDQEQDTRVVVDKIRQIISRYHDNTQLKY